MSEKRYFVLSKCRVTWHQSQSIAIEHRWRLCGPYVILAVWEVVASTHSHSTSWDQLRHVLDYTPDSSLTGRAWNGDAIGFHFVTRNDEILKWDNTIPIEGQGIQCKFSIIKISTLSHSWNRGNFFIHIKIMWNFGLTQEIGDPSKWELSTCLYAASMPLIELEVASQFKMPQQCRLID